MKPWDNIGARRGGALQSISPLLGLLLLCGCNSWLPEMIPFGAVTAPDHNRSLNGLGLHRKMWESTGAKCLTPQKLSPKLDSMDVIVLVGQSYAPPGRAARSWLERWLARGTGRSVIYFGRDFNADNHYRELTMRHVYGRQRARGEELLALRRAQELNLRLRQVPESTHCGWFFMDVNQRRTEHASLIGPWADDLHIPPRTTAPGWRVGVALHPPDDKRWRANQPSWLQPPPQARKLVSPAQLVERLEDEGDAIIERSTWQLDELDRQDKWEAAFNRAAASEILLASSDGQPLVFRLTDERFGDGQILVLANGAPLLNGSLVDQLYQQIGEKVIENCIPAQRVALVAYAENGLLISSAEEKDARAAGLEMLTVWPLSGITMPAALLGIIVCAALLPILGRPQSLKSRSVSDFGLHVDAIGHLLQEARDVKHAKSVIEEYFRKVRNEAPPGWLETLDSADSQNSRNHPK